MIRDESFDRVPHMTTRHSFSFLAAAALLVVACGGEKQEEPHSAIENFTTFSSAQPSAGPVPESADSKANKDELNDEQKQQLEIALRRGGDKVGNCINVVPDAKAADGDVTVVFDGKKGRCVDVQVPNPWAGTDAEMCIKRAFVGEIVVPFEGTLEVPYTIHVGKKGDDAKEKDKKPKGKGGK
jgi:hypothetical protein